MDGMGMGMGMGIMRVGIIEYGYHWYGYHWYGYGYGYGYGHHQYLYGLMGVSMGMGIMNYSQCITSHCVYLQVFLWFVLLVLLCNDGLSFSSPSGEERCWYLGQADSRGHQTVRL